MQDPLIQTRVPEAVHAKLLREAAREGETIASWLRRLVYRELKIEGRPKAAAR